MIEINRSTKNNSSVIGNFESVEKRLRLAETRLEEAQVTARQFEDDSTHPSIEKAKAELAVARKLVEIRSWEREIALAESRVTQAQADLNGRTETRGSKVLGARNRNCESGGESS